MSKKRTQSQQAILAYVPVLHQGYLNFFATHSDVKTLILPDQELLHAYRPLAKDLRALPPEQMKTIIESLGLFDRVEVATAGDLEEWNNSDSHLIAPDEDITHELVDIYVSQAETIYDTVFLRYDKVRTTKQINIQPDAKITRDELDQQLMAQAKTAAERSSDWWRQVGAVLTHNGNVLYEAHNHHVPQVTQQYTNGDPRANFHAGEQIELTTAMHAEASVIARAAHDGVSIAGASLYCTTFPCPVCAKLIAAAGIAKVYYSGGYAMVDGEDVLKSAGVELIQVVD